MNIKIKNTLIIASAIAVIGLVIGIIGFALGGSQAIYASKDGFSLADDKGNALNQSFTEIKSIDAELDIRDIVLQEGSGYSIQSKRVSENFSVDDNNGNLIIKEREKSGFSFNIFGIFSETQNAEVIITYPKGATFDEIAIVSDVGSISISDLSATKISIDSDIGHTNLKNVTIGNMIAEISSGNLNLDNTSVENFQFDIDLGNLTAKEFTGTTINGISSSGKVSIAGNVTGAIDIENDLGDVNLTLKGEDGSFSYDLETDLGSISINGQKTGTNLSRLYENKPLIRLVVDSGDVNIDFVK